MLNKVEIDLNAISNNVRVFREIIDIETKIIGVVKANAYGHGLVDTARAIWTSGADILATFNIEEAISLRVAKIRCPILIIGYVEPKDFRRLLDFDLTITIFNPDDAIRLNQEATKQNKWARVDLKIDTGMNRFGISPLDAIEQYQKISSLEHIKITGIHSHFADANDRDYSHEQIRQMQNVLFGLQQIGSSAPMVHMAATAGSFLYSEAHFDAIRVGIGLYGYYDSKTEEPKLMPALEFKSQVAQVKRVAKGESVGYARTFYAEKPLKIAVIPCGYSDGYSRGLSNKAYVLLHGKRARVIGRICMNIFMIDVTGINCAVGDEVILIGSQGGGKVSAEDLATLDDTIPHEILSRINPNLPREYHFK
jgi:alanine racemase